MSGDPTSGFSPIDDEPPLRALRRIGLVPRNSLGIGRRVAVLVALAWGVPVVWALLNGRLWPGDAAGEPLLSHYGLHARFLVAVALLVVAEAVADRGLKRVIAQFTASGAVGAAARLPFERLLRDTARLRDRTLPWVVVAGVALGWTLGHVPDSGDDALTWATGARGELGFGGWWMLYVSRPIFVVLLLAWAWRLLLTTLLFARIGRLELALVPTHPDRQGGIGFVQALPGALAPVVLALSMVVTSQWAHDVLYHGTSLASLKLPAAALVVTLALLPLLPLLVLAPALIGTKARALPAYAALVGEHGRQVHRRWILREPVADDRLIDAAEIGPVADAAAMYQAVAAMQPVPVGKRAIVPLVLAIGLPLVVLVALRLPLKSVLGHLLKALV